MKDHKLYDSIYIKYPEQAKFIGKENKLVDVGEEKGVEDEGHGGNCLVGTEFPFGIMKHRQLGSGDGVQHFECIKCHKFYVKMHVIWLALDAIIKYHR